mgnify:FL=1
MRPMKEITLPTISPAREVSRHLQFSQEYPPLAIRDRPFGYMRIMKNDEPVALVIKGKENYVLLSEDERLEYPCANLEQVALLVSVLQQSGCDWLRVEEFFDYNQEELDLDFD